MSYFTTYREKIRKRKETPLVTVEKGMVANFFEVLQKFFITT